MPPPVVAIRGQRHPVVLDHIRIQTDPAALIERHWNQIGGSPGPQVSGIEHMHGGSRTRYRHGAIYIVGSQIKSTHFVYGAIFEHYDRIGGPGSYLGFPISEELPFTDGGRMQSFQRGEIYWWPDTGAIDLNEVVVHYTGLICYAETDHDQMSPADEPYVTIGVVTPAGTATEQRRYEGVDAGEGRPDVAELYRGKPAGIALSALLMEHDDDDPNRYKEAMNTAVGVAAGGLGTLIGVIPVVGVPLALVAAPFLAAATPVIADELNNLLDLRDDQLGVHNTTLSAKQLVVLAGRTEMSAKHGVGYKVETPSYTREGAEYRVYYNVMRA